MRELKLKKNLLEEVILARKLVWFETLSFERRTHSFPIKKHLNIRAFSKKDSSTGFAIPFDLTSPGFSQLGPGLISSMNENIRDVNQLAWPSPNLPAQPQLPVQPDLNYQLGPRLLLYSSVWCLCGLCVIKDSVPSQNQPLTGL